MKKVILKETDERLQEMDEKINRKVKGLRDLINESQGESTGEKATSGVVSTELMNQIEDMNDKMQQLET